MPSDHTSILLVDDQPANLAVLEATLAGLAEELVSVTSGEAALREVLARDFAVVLLDVRMPTMNGFELAEMIRQHPRTQAVPIIFLTAGDAQEFPIERAYALGAVDYMTKPLNTTVLRAKAGVFIELHRKRAELARIEEERHRAALQRRDEQLARSERQLDESRDRFSLLLASSGEGIFGLDREGRCTFLNPAGAALLGFRAEELEGRPLHPLIHYRRADGSPYPSSDCAILAAARNGSALRVDEDTFWRRDGSPLPVAYSVYPMVFKGRTEGAVLTFTDISGRREAQAERERLYKELQAASERMLDIFHRAPALMCVMSGPQHVVEMANERFLELAGGRALAGLALASALPELEGQDFVELIERVYRSGEACEGTNARLLLRAASHAQYPRAGLDEHYLDFVCMALREPDGKVAGVLLHGVDVTERTRANALAVGQRGALELAVTDAPLGDVLDVLARTAEDYSGGAALASVQLVSADGQYLRHAAAPSLPLDFQVAIDAIRIGPVAGAAGGAAWRAEPVTTADIASAPLWDGWTGLPLEHGLHGCRALPILAPSGAVLGTFTLYYRDAGEPQAQEEAALALLANTASLVIGQRHEAVERQAAEHRSRAILESMSEGFIALDANWCITYANGAFETVTRRRRDDLIGGQFWDLFPELRGGVREQALRRSFQSRTPSRIEVFDEAEGRWFEINSFAMEAPGTGDGMALYFRDETDRRRAEEGIRRLAAVAEQSSDFIGIFTPDAGGIYLNPAGRRLAGLGADTDIAAWRMLDFFPREDHEAVRGHMMAALTGEQAEWEGELRLAQPDGRAPVPVYFKGFAVRDAEGQNIGLATITRDITEQKRAEDELRRVAADLAEADHRKSEFLATLAHELRNPLAPIRTGLDLLRMTPRTAERDEVSLERLHGMMDRQLGHLIHLVDDLLDIARITRGKIELKKEPVLLRTIAATAVETSTALIEAHGHQLTVELPSEPIELEADVTRMVQVLSNLLNNAAKYTPAGGRVTLSARREDGQAVIAVSDSGIGIPPDAIGSVFEMFTQVRGSLDRAQGGLGIGLSLVRRLVELHGGRVSAYSAGRGQGSTFTVRLPLRAGGAHAHAREGEAFGAQAATAPGPLRVLVVDDNLDAAESLVALLELLGHETRAAHDGVQGLEAAREFLPDLVFLDIGLPGMSGYDVARAIRATPALRQVVLVALTGWGGQSDQRQSHEAGFDQHLTKPVSLEALEQTLATAGRALP